MNLRDPFSRVSRFNSSVLDIPVMSDQTQKSSQRPDRPSNVALGVLVSWLASNLSAHAIAADLSLGNSGLRFNRDTAVESRFLESHGAYQSTFGVLNLDTKQKTPLLVETKPADDPAPIARPSTGLNDRGTRFDFLGTPGRAVPQAVTQFTFRANNNYVFYLESTFNGRPAGTVYSTDTLNPNRERQVIFTGTPTDLCTPSGMTLAWDDTGAKLVKNRQQQDRDFDDFIVRLRGTACATAAIAPPAVVETVPPSDATTGGVIPPSAVGQVPPAIGGATGGGAGLIGLGVLGLGGAIALLGSGGNNNNHSSPAGVVFPTTTPPGTNPPGITPPGITPPITPPESGGLPGEPVPTPSTFLGSAMALGLIVLMRRRPSQRRKKQ